MAVANATATRIIGIRFCIMKLDTFYYFDPELIDNFKNPSTGKWVIIIS